MNLAALFIAASLVTLLASGLLIWVWCAIARVEEDLRAFSGFEGMHFEFCAAATDGAVNHEATHPALKPNAFVSAWRSAANRVAGIFRGRGAMPQNNPVDR